MFLQESTTFGLLLQLFAQKTSGHTGPELHLRYTDPDAIRSREHDFTKKRRKMHLRVFGRQTTFLSVESTFLALICYSRCNWWMVNCSSRPVCQIATLIKIWEIFVAIHHNPGNKSVVIHQGRRLMAWQCIDNKLPRFVAYGESSYSQKRDSLAVHLPTL